MKNIFVFLIGILLLTGACGQNNSSDEPAGHSPIGHIQVDAYVGQTEYGLLAAAVSYLDSISTLWDSTLTQMMGISSLSSYDLHQWLEDRVQYIVAHDFNAEERSYYVTKNYAYENPYDIPSLQGSAVGDSQAQVLMFNLGTLIYINGKNDRNLYGLRIARVGDVPVTSPRVGIVQLGTALFENVKQSTSAYNIFLLGVLFHEARHSDGHGKTLGFTHAICPRGHAYQGLAACDRNLNGPYALEANLVRNLISNCRDCTSQQREILKQINLDNYSRVLKSSTLNGMTVTSTNWDPAPEGHR